MIRAATLIVILLSPVVGIGATIQFPDRPAFKVEDQLKFLFTKIPLKQMKTDSTGNRHQVFGFLALDTRNVREPKRSQLIEALESLKSTPLRFDGLEIDFSKADIEIVGSPISNLNNWSNDWGASDVRDFKYFHGQVVKLPTPRYLIYDEENQTAAEFVRQAHSAAKTTKNLIAPSHFSQALQYTDRRHLTISSLDLAKQEKFMDTLSDGKRLHANLLLVPIEGEPTILQTALFGITDGLLVNRIVLGFNNEYVTVAQTELKKQIESCRGELK